MTSTAVLSRRTEERIEEDCARVALMNQPYEEEQQKRRWWKRSFRFFRGRFYITISNCRVKKRPTSCDHERSQRMGDIMREIKGYRYRQQQGRCPECGQHYELRQMELHHVLPWGRFPELRAKKANLALLCHDCHKEIHCNPWRNIELMRAKAAELGVDLSARYERSQIEILKK